MTRECPVCMQRVGIYKQFGALYYRHHHSHGPECPGARDCSLASGREGLCLAQHQRHYPNRSRIERLALIVADIGWPKIKVTIT